MLTSNTNRHEKNNTKIPRHTDLHKNSTTQYGRGKKKLGFLLQMIPRGGLLGLPTPRPTTLGLGQD